ncbi:branched-chain amino acid ABC transporter ATP-binding protein/permease [Albimonas pacifica]|uniref:Amino acid/amide ABC transporter membrane protein 2, HAAT family n=1 Tax=Albimonas pacifica TaxID=1114924 RepID=A0A1I3FSL2_9RHOB|nr:branched-chain amino acid ABC transporter ATP-binding protein/permease [Albimonas pacifica]SFI14189.1 amino acid/amide ABC transporter membrane protein 2, HAAT family [Albimonas pacifica]
MTSRSVILLATLAALVLLPVVVPLLGLTVSTAAMIVTLSLAAIGLNMMMGEAGLVSFGHGAWFGVGGYAAALSQKAWFPDQVILPLLFGMVFVGLAATVIGALMLRRRGVYFALMTLALSALTYSVAFRWTEVTGGEDGLGGLTRGTILGVDLADNLTYYVFTAVVAFAAFYALLRVKRSSFGHALNAIRENQPRAEFQGWRVDRLKLAVFALSASITALAGGLAGFQHYIVTAESTHPEFGGELLAMVVIGGMHGNILGPAVGAVFYILFREVLSSWTGDWLFWFGLIFVAFVMYLPGGLMGLYAALRRRISPPPAEAAAMASRKIYKDLPLPDFLRPAACEGQVLTVEGVSKNFGGIQAVRGAELQVEAGSIHALIGPNGAGKTTLFNLISGRFRPTAGKIRLLGQDVTGLDPASICHAGLGRSFQITSLHEGLTIEENIRLSIRAKSPRRHDAWRDVEKLDEVNAKAAELIRFLGLEGIEKARGGDLSYGGQRLVDLGIALASAPRVLLLDEPLAGLAAAERERVGALIERVSKTIPILIVEHDIDRVLGFSKVVTVMNDGAVLVSADPDAIRTDRRVQEIYTGSGAPAAQVRRRPAIAMPDFAPPAEPLLKVEGVNAFYGKSHILDDARLEVRPGEIVALLGHNGAGKSTFLKTIAGLVPARSGSIRFAGRELAGLPAPDIARAGIGYVPQGRGLFAGMSVRDNLSLGRLARPAGAADAVRWSEEEIFAFFPRLAERIDSHADFLSGGEQQMLAVARALSADVRLLLLDEPFEGLAPAVVEDLFKVLDALRDRLGVVIVEHNLDQVLALSDRVFALENGAVFHEGPAVELLCDLDRRKQVLWL